MDPRGPQQELRDLFRLQRWDIQTLEGMVHDDAAAIQGYANSIQPNCRGMLAHEKLQGEIEPAAEQE